MTDAIDLTTEQRNQLSALLRRFLPGVAVWAYGSRVKWTARPNSDLDLVAFTTPAQGPQVAELKDVLAESNLPFPVDLHVWDEVPERFREIIRKEYVVVQEAKPLEKQDVADKWNEMKLGDAIELKRGYDLSGHDRRDGPFPIVSSSGISGRHAEAKAKAPGVVIGRYGTLGEVHYVTEDYWPLNTALYVRDFKGNDPRFVSYFLRSLDFSAYSDKAAVPGLNRNDLHTAQVSLPPCDEQRSIAHILGTLDDKIKLNRRMNETLEAMARALFKSWFVDFDPVRAKAEGRNPGLPKSIADLFPDSFVDSELGEIPEGWRLATLPEVIDVNPTRALRKGAEAPYLDMANMPTQGHSPDDVIARAFGSGMRFMNGDTLVARITPCLENGKTAFVDFLEAGEVGWGSTEYIVLRPKPPLPEEFAYCLARSNEFRDFAIQKMTGSSGRQRVPAESLSHFRVAVAPKPVVECFGQLIKPFFTRASAASREGRTLTAIRDTLLPKLFSGELRVKNVEKFIGGTSV